MKEISMGFFEGTTKLKRCVYHICIFAAAIAFPPVCLLSGADNKSDTLISLADGNNAFAVDIYLKLKDDEGNVFFSPYSISTAMAMAYAGARGNTEKEMSRALHFSLEQEKLHPAFAELGNRLVEIQKKGKIKLLTANSLWPQTGYKFLEGFIGINKRFYGVEITPLDFNADPDGSGKIINSWVEQKTERKICNLINKTDPRTRLVLVNAIYFKGNWARQFDPKNTLDMNFYLLNGSTTKTSMMFQKGRFRIKEKENTKVLEIPYADKNLSMFIILPDRKDGIKKLQNVLTTVMLSEMLSETEEVDAEIYIPKFKISYGTVDLTENFKKLGMNDAFDKRADFSGMTGNKELFISGILHKAFIELNEEGAEAAAATAVVMGFKSAKTEKPFAFKADHPFIFVLRENSTGSILFMGTIVKP